MTELGEGTRALLDAARDGDEPRPEDRARVRAALALALAAPPNAAGGAKAAAAKATASTTAWGPLLGAVGLASLAVVGATAALSPSPPVAVLQPLPTELAASFVVPPEAPPLPAETGAVAITEPAEVLPDAAVTPPRALAPRSRASAAEPNGTPSLEAEARALAEAQRALAAGDPARAKALLDEQGKAFGAGALGPERSAAEVFALCSLGRVAEARARAAAFLREHAGSPLAPRVAAACDGAAFSSTEAAGPGHEPRERAGTETPP